MVRTQNSAKTLTPRVLNVDKEVEKLTVDITSFGKSDITTNFFDVEEQVQRDLKEEFVDFTVFLANKENRIEKYREVAGYDNLTPEQSRV